MESRAFSELKYRALNYYLNNIKIGKEATFNWERKLPLGKSKYEHYRKAGKMLLDFIRENVKHQEAAILIVPSSFSPILVFADDYAKTDICSIAGVYQCGILGETAVAVDPTILSGEEAYMLLIDFTSDEAIRITQGKYDYDADLAEEIAHTRELDMLIPDEMLNK